MCIIYHCGFFHLPFLLFERAHLLPKLVRGFPYLSLKLSLAPSSCFTLSALWKLGELLREGETGVISQANHSHHTNRCRRDKVRERKAVQVSSVSSMERIVYLHDVSQLEQEMLVFQHTLCKVYTCVLQLTERQPSYSSFRWSSTDCDSLTSVSSKRSY